MTTRGAPHSQRRQEPRLIPTAVTVALSLLLFEEGWGWKSLEWGCKVNKCVSKFPSYKDTCLDLEPLCSTVISPELIIPAKPLFKDTGSRDY